MVAAMSSNQTMRASLGAIGGTVASSSVARVMPIRLPAIPAASVMVTPAGAWMTMRQRAVRVCEHHHLGAVDGHAQRRDRDIGPAGQQRRDALRAVDLNELHLDAHVLGELAPDRDLGAVGLALGVEHPERRRRHLRRHAELLFLEDPVERGLGLRRHGER